MYACVAMINSQTIKHPPTGHRLVLAPMEGVVDSVMRDLLTKIGGYDRCVTEFVRISQTVLPPRVFYRLCPELLSNGRTPTGTPVFVQLLGSNPDLMARNAQVAEGLGAPGIDLNFGCPAKTVNKSHGGAVLLKTPDLLHAVCSEVRDAVAPEVPVTAKIRLGFEDDGQFEAIVNAAVTGGISELTIHAKTRRQGYRPPAHWARLAQIAKESAIPIIANGELWSPGDVVRCGQVSHCEHFMLARGALCRPDLARAVRHTWQGIDTPAMTWTEVFPLLQIYLRSNANAYEPRHACNPLKQWLVYLKHYFPQAGALFAAVKRIKDFDDMDRALETIEPEISKAA